MFRTFVIAFVLILDLNLLIEVQGQECGKVNFIEQRILGGIETSRGQWPFLAALYHADKSNFFCGSTVISAKHVLTGEFSVLSRHGKNYCELLPASHCVQPKGVSKKLQPDDVIVLLGRYNLDLKVERGAVQRSVDDIRVHPDWNAFEGKFDADIAILVLNEIIEFTSFIRPVCLPSDFEEISDFGLVVGWGISENAEPNKHVAILRQASTQSVNDSYCYTKSPEIATFSSTRTFCGSDESKSDGSPNNGDSGGGFLVLSGSHWVQKGIISSSLSNAWGRETSNPFSVYTNVIMFKEWISNVLKQSGLEVLTKDDVHLENIDLSCVYEIVLNVM